METQVPDERKFSRKRHQIRLARREDVERHLFAIIQDALRQVDPTAYPPAVRVVAELASVIASQLIVQSQSTQRAFITLQDDIADYGTEFVSQLVSEARKAVGRRVRRISASPSPVGTPAPLQLADDWAGPVAGPTLIEKHFGIPRSTLYRWQKRNEAIALNTRTSRKPVFPLRQFVDGKPVSGIADLVQIFGDPRTAWRWLVEASSDFEGKAPLDALLKGQESLVVDKARRLATIRIRAHPE